MSPNPPIKAPVHSIPIAGWAGFGGMKANPFLERLVRFALLESTRC